ncbi:MAG: DinB family protein [Chitinophagales bacterium]|nr:DinB family protein [Chitinophagales bacterium]
MNTKADLVAPSYYYDFFNLIEENEINLALSNSLHTIKRLDVQKLSALKQRAYFPGKWTVNELLQHLIDTERIFNYRVLHIVRKDENALLGFDENAYAANSYANEREISDLIDELILVRESTTTLFKSLNKIQLKTIGKIGDNEVSVEAIGFCTIGHQLHHFDILKERYFPLLDS